MWSIELLEVHTKWVLNFDKEMLCSEKYYIYEKATYYDTGYEKTLNRMHSHANMEKQRDR